MEETKLEQSEQTRLQLAYENAMARLERSNRRLFVLLVICLSIIAGMFAYETQFIDEVTETVTTTTDNGGNAYGTIISGENSEVHYGESGCDPQENQNP